MSMINIVDKDIFFHRPGKGEETCLLTCRPKDVELTSAELRLLGSAMVKAADAIDSVSHDGYTKVTTHEWYFDCADSRWMLAWEDETHVDARRQGEWDRWVIGFAKGEDGMWWCEGTDAGEVGRFVPSDVCDAVTTHVLKHGVPA